MSFKLLKKIIVGASPERLSAVDLTVSQAWIQARRSNSHTLEIAPETFVSGDGGELAIPSAGAQLPEISLSSISSGGNNLNLYNWLILGTPGEGVNIIYEEF